MELVISILATYGISIAITESDGPGDIFSKLRNKKSMAVLRCFVCTSLWVAFVIALFIRSGHLIISAAAYAGGAIVLDRFNV